MNIATYTVNACKPTPEAVHQRETSGIGVALSHPIKRRDSKSLSYVFGHDTRWQNLEALLAELVAECNTGSST